MTCNRLSTKIIPTNYALLIRPDLDRLTFEGTVTITISALESTDELVLNIKNLTINRVVCDKMGCKFTSGGDETLHINTKLDKDSVHKLTVHFNGILNDHMEGFYASKYTINGVQRYMATTQFEPTNARQAFPCFDEPSFKATFDITIVGPKDKTILSNTKPKSVKIVENEQMITFETTPIMSTYLVAFIVADLEYIESVTKSGGIVVRTYATPGSSQSKLKFALEVAVKALEWYISWFEIDYPLSKLDLVAIPDFSSGAMENWGLITFREDLLLTDVNTELAERQDVVVTICHELAHQWFGNLVTMEWWTYLWLNESMATYFGWLVSDILFPEWNMWNNFIEQEYITALELDSLESSHPIEVPIERAGDIESIFDAISYSKGSCLIRFLVNFMGMDEFRRGMQLYLNKHRYKNTVSDDLWQCFGTEIRDIMQCWTKQTGYPLVCITCNKSYISVSQTRFYKYGSAMSKSDQYIWHIPIELQLSNSKKLSFVLNKSLATYQVNEDVIVVNPDRIGFYRTKYATTPNMSKMPIQDVIHAINDSFCLAISGYQGFSEPLQMIKQLNLATERNYFVWKSFIPYLNTLEQYTEKEATQHTRIKDLISQLCLVPLRSLYRELDWESSDDHHNDNLRELVITQLARMNDETVVSDGLKLFREGKWENKRSLVLPIVGKYGTIDDYRNLLSTLDTHPNAASIILISLASVRNTQGMQLATSLIFSENKIRDQDLLLYIRQLSINRNTRDLVWDLVTTNWSFFTTKYPAGSSGSNNLLKSVAAGFITEEQLHKYREFFTKNKPEGADMTLEQTVEKISSHILVVKRVLADPVFQ